MSAHPDDHSTDAGMSFFSSPRQVADWRQALLYDAAAKAGLLDDLPATADELAARHDLAAHAVRVLLDALTAWDVVEQVADGRYAAGAGLPGEDEGALIRHHARAVRRWSARIDDRLRGVPDPTQWRPDAAQLELWLRALAVMGRRWAPAAVDACLALRPDARNVLDLGGGHGEYAREFARRGLRATVQDKPETIEMLRATGWLTGSGVELFAGDFFQTLPDDTFDLVFCAGVTYTYGRERNVDLYRQARSVIAPGGGLAIVTLLRGQHPESAIFALQMLMGGSEADTHGEDDYRAWLAEAGYGSMHVQATGEPPDSLVFASVQR